MANVFSTASYSATVDSTNLASVTWTATLNGIAQAGFAVIPANAGVYPTLEFFRGGLATTDSALSDELAQALENLSNLMVTRGTKVDRRLFIMAPDYPQGNGSITGGTAGGGTDEFGGADLESCAVCFGTLSEFGKVNNRQRAVMGTSRGGMQALRYLKEYRNNPKCVVLWNPYINVKDWDNVAAQTQTDIGAMIPDFRPAPVPTSAKDLSRAEVDALVDRSPVEWVEDLPRVPYLILHGDNDTTSPRAWIDALVERMDDAGHDVELGIIADGGHVFANEALTAALNRTADFLGEHLAA